MFTNYGGGGERPAKTEGGGQPKQKIVFQPPCLKWRWLDALIQAFMTFLRYADDRAWSPAGIGMIFTLERTIGGWPLSLGSTSMDTPGWSDPVEDEVRS